MNLHLETNRGGYDRLYAAHVGSTLWGYRPGRLIREIDRLGGVIGTALDAGCGDGKNAAALESAGWDVTGFDVSTTAIRLLRGRAPRLAGVYRSQGLDDYLEDSDSTFDLVVSYGLFHCLDPGERVGLHRELQRRAKRGGLIAFTTLLDDRPWPEGHGTTNLTLANDSEIEQLVSGHEVLYEERGVIEEHHLPTIGWHAHSAVWLVLRAPG